MKTPTLAASCSAIFFAFMTGGCAGQPSEPENSFTPSARASTVETMTGAIASALSVMDGDVVTDSEGRRWRARQIANFVHRDPSETPEIGANRSASTRELSDEELADALRPIRLEVRGLDQAIEYTSLDPVNVETIHVARQKDREGRRMRQIGIGKFEELPADAPISVNAAKTSWPAFDSKAFDVDTTLLPQPSTLGLIIGGADNRTWVPYNGLTTIHQPQIQFSRTPVDDCSGTLIGNRTAISAAHCFHTGGADPAHVGWLNTYTWYAGRIKYKNNITMVDVDTSLVPASGTGSNCYTVTLPANWINNGYTDHTDDFAVVEFNCGIQPGLTTGLIAQGIGSPADYNVGATYLDAYDQDNPQPGQLPGALKTYKPKSLITRNGPAGSMQYDYSNICGATVSGVGLFHTFDATGASSGGGMMTQLFTSVGDPTWYWVGNHWGNPPSSTTFHCARLLTWGSAGFITAATTEW